MAPTDNTPRPLAIPHRAARAGRSISTRDYALPKPYRRKRFIENEQGMSRLRMTVLTLSALLIASLIAALVVLAKQQLDAPPIPIVAAPRQSAPIAVPEPAPPLNDRQPVAAVEVRDEPPRLVPMAARMSRAVHAVRKPEPVAPDPDVVLITAILTLTPPPEPEPLLACTSSIVGGHGCTAMEP